MRESQDRQLGQLEKGVPAGNRGVKVNVEDGEEACTGKTAQGQLAEKGNGTDGNLEEVIVGETLRPKSNISNDLDSKLQQECFPVASKSDSNLIFVKPAPDTSSKDI